MKAAPAGYREIEHTADWELEVWAPDMAALLEQAARGMYRLMAVEIARGDRVERRLDIGADDGEGLLVEFLGDLLYLAESEGLAFDHMELSLRGSRLSARLEGATIVSQGKEIKAVTFHRLAVERSEAGVRTRVVFDV